MKKILVILLMLLCLPIVFAEEEMIIVMLEDGTIETRPISDFITETETVSAMRRMAFDAPASVEQAVEIARITPGIKHADSIQPIYLADVVVEGIPVDVNNNDSWRFDYTKMTSMWNDISALDYSNIVVAVIDSGIDVDHPDLNYIGGYDFANDDNDPSDPSGFNNVGHGTHVSGTIGARRDQGADNVVGIAPGVQIMMLKVFTDAGFGDTADLASALRYAIDQGVDVINMSLSYDTENTTVTALLEEAETNGIVVVAAAANESNHWMDGETYDRSYDSDVSRQVSSVKYPARYSTVMAIGSVAVNPQDDNYIGISDFSNGDNALDSISTPIDIVAPGSNIYSTNYLDVNNASVLSGTSMASPHVAGLAALLVAKYPGLDASEIRTLMRETAYLPTNGIEVHSDFNPVDVLGSGLMNVENALTFSPIKELDFSLGEFSYNRNIYEYSFLVPAGTDAITMSGLLMSDATATLNGTSTDLSENITLSTDETILTILATYGTETKTYEIVITKSRDDLKLADISLNGVTLDEFHQERLVYDLDEYPYDTTFTFNASLLDNTSTLQYKLNDGDYNGNDISSVDTVIELLPGVNTISFKVIATDASFQIYTITLSRDNGVDLTQIDTIDLIDTTTVQTHLFDGIASSESYIISYQVNKISLDVTKEYSAANVTAKLNDGSFEVYDSGWQFDLPKGENTITIRVEAGNFGDPDYSTKDYTLIITHVAPKTDATLSGLSITGYDFVETFNSNTLEYTLNVAHSVDSLTVNAVRSDSNADVSINGDLTLTKEMILEDGSNQFLILVTAEDGITTKTYKITITRNLISSDANLTSLLLEGLVLDETFDKDRLEYHITVPYGTSSVLVKASKSYVAASLTIDGEPLSEKNVALDETGKVISVLVIAEDGTQKTYVITIVREPLSTNANLSTLNITNQTINESFNEDTLDYTSNVSNGTSTISISATAASSQASVSINGLVQSPRSIDLVVGSNTVIILVTAESGAIKEYKITITRASAPVVTPPPVVIPPPVIVPPPAPVLEPPEDSIETVIGENGQEITVVEVSEERVLEEIADERVALIEISAETTEQAEITLDPVVLDAIATSDKPVDIVFDAVTFQMNQSLFKSLNVKEKLSIHYNQKENSTGDGHVISKVFELDIYDGDTKVAKIVKPIPIVLAYNRSSVTNTSNLAVYFYDEKLEEWVYVGGKLETGNKISFEARHFSKYAIREYQKTFDDIKAHWAKSYIETLASRQITSGVSEKAFAPDKTLTVAEFVVLVSKVLGLPTYDGDLPYVNVPEGAWYEQFFKNAYNANILMGSLGVLADPNEPIKREEMASILIAAYTYYSGISEGEILITENEKAIDMDAVSTHFKRRVNMAYQLGLITGDDMNRFNPQNGATRAEAAVVIKKLLILLELL